MTNCMKNFSYFYSAKNMDAKKAPQCKIGQNGIKPKLSALLNFWYAYSSL